MGGAQPFTTKDTNPTKHSLKEGLKEVGRYLVFGVLVEIAVVVLPVVLLGINSQTGEIAVNWQLAYATGLITLLTATLRGLDKFKHVRSKLNSPEKDGESQGLLWF